VSSKRLVLSIFHCAVHGSGGIASFCAEPREDNGDAAADGFAAGEVGFGAEEKEWTVAGRGEFGDVGAVQIDFGLYVRSLNDGAVHTMFIQFKAELIADSKALL
jgi:hypothetical protein